MTLFDNDGKEAAESLRKTVSTQQKGWTEMCRLEGTSKFQDASNTINSPGLSFTETSGSYKVLTRFITFSICTSESELNI